MKKKIGIAACFITCLVIGAFVVGKNYNHLKADNNETFDYKVLELVSDESQAVFGYLVDGQEPINLSNYENNLDDIKSILAEGNLLEMEGYREVPYITINELSAAEQAALGSDITKYNQSGFYKKSANGVARYTPVFATAVSNTIVRYDKFEEGYIVNVACTDHVDVTGGIDEEGNDTSDDICDICYRRMSNLDEYVNEKLYYAYKYDEATKTYLTDYVFNNGVFYFENGGNTFALKDDVDEALSTDKEYIFSFKLDDAGEWSFYPIHKSRRYIYNSTGSDFTVSLVPSDFYNEYYFSNSRNLYDGSNTFIFKSSLSAIESQDESTYIENFRLINKNLFEKYVVPGKNVQVVTKTYKSVTVEDINSADFIYVNTGNSSNVLRTFWAKENGCYELNTESGSYEIKIADVSKTSELSSAAASAILNRLADRKAVIFFDSELSCDGETLSGLNKVYAAVNMTYPTIARRVNLMQYGSLMDMHNFVIGIPGGYTEDYTLFGFDNLNLDSNAVAEHNVLTFADAKFNILSDFLTRVVDDIDTTKEVYEGYDFKNTKIPVVQVEGVDKANAAICLNYLISSPKVSVLNNISELKILELEPCNDFYDDNYWSYRALGIDPYYTGSVKVTQQSTRTFSSSAANIYNDYDIVYFGSRYGMMNYSLHSSNESSVQSISRTTTVPYTSMGFVGTLSGQASVASGKAGETVRLYAFSDGTWDSNTDDSHVGYIDITPSSSGVTVTPYGYYGYYGKIPVIIDSNTYYLSIAQSGVVGISGGNGYDFSFAFPNNSSDNSISSSVLKSAFSIYGADNYTYSASKLSGSNLIGLTGSGDKLKIGTVSEDLDGAVFADFSVKQKAEFYPYNSSKNAIDMDTFISSDGTDGYIRYKYVYADPDKADQAVYMTKTTGSFLGYPLLSTADFRDKNMWTYNNNGLESGIYALDKNTDYTVKISIPDAYKTSFGTLAAFIWEYDRNCDYLGNQSYIYNGKTYTPRENTEYIKIRFFSSTVSNIAESTYESAFDDGFYCGLYTNSPYVDTCTFDSMFKGEFSSINNSLRLYDSLESIDLTDVNSWRAGQYNYQTGLYESSTTRVCLKDYMSLDYTSYKLNMPSDLAVLIREFTSDGKFKASKEVKNTEVYSPDADVSYVGISLYKPGPGGVSINDMNNIEVSFNPTGTCVRTHNASLVYNKFMNCLSDKYDIRLGSDICKVEIIEVSDSGTRLAGSFSDGDVYEPSENVKIFVSVVGIDDTLTNSQLATEIAKPEFHLSFVGDKDPGALEYTVYTHTNATVKKSFTTLPNGTHVESNTDADNVDQVIVHDATGKIVGYVISSCYVSKRNVTMLCYPSEFKNYNEIRTVFNDSSMNGKVYFHTGDTLELGTAFNFSGMSWLSDERDVQRLSGNDITNKAYQALLTFSKKGKIIMFSNVFYKNDGSIDESTLDNMSYVAKLIKNNEAPVYNEAKLKNYDFSILESTEYDLNITDMPLVYRDYTKGNWGGNSVTFSGYTSDDGGKTEYTYEELGIESADDKATAFYVKDRNVSIDFNISQIANSDEVYKIEMYVDSISDGRFASDEQVQSIRVYEGDSQVRVNALHANTNYSLKFKIADTLNGIVHWQLRLYKAGENESFKEYSNYFAIYTPAENAVTLNVLQIGPSSGETFNMATNTSFKNYLNNVAEYNVIVFHATESDLVVNGSLKPVIFTEAQVQNYYNSYNSSTGRNVQYNGGGLSLQDFDMLVLGYADYGYYFSDESLLNAVNNYISSGKAVLMTHDLIDFNQSSAAPVTSHVYMNKYFRTVFGQDRYGINTRPDNPVYDDVKHSRDDTYWNNFGHDITQFSEAMKSLGFDYASDQSGYSSDGIDGMTDAFLIRMAKTNHEQYYPYSNSNVYFGKYTTGTINSDTNKVSLLNAGQISTYPYKISDRISIAITHAQYFQINPESDELTVWYCLYEPEQAASNNGYVIPKNTIWADYNDGINNYYIYTNKNVTYSGVGHSAGMTNDEMKLFVNTLIMAYRAAAVTPEIDVINENVDVYDNNVDIYLDYDVTDPTKLLDSSIVNGKFRLKFQIRQSFAGMNINNYIQFVDSEGAQLPYVLYSGISDQPLNSITNDGHNYWSLDDSEFWYFDIPVDEINSMYGFSFDSAYQYQFRFNLLTTYGMDNAQISDFYDVKVIKRGLFNMH